MLNIVIACIFPWPKGSCVNLGLSCRCFLYNKYCIVLSTMTILLMCSCKGKNYLNHEGLLLPVCIIVHCIIHFCFTGRKLFLPVDNQHVLLFSGSTYSSPYCKGSFRSISWWFWHSTTSSCKRYIPTCFLHMTILVSFMFIWIIGLVYFFWLLGILQSLVYTLRHTLQRQSVHVEFNYIPLVLSLHACLQWQKRGLGMLIIL